MNVVSKKFALFSLAGGLGVGACAMTVLFMAREPMGWVFSLKFLGITTGVGLFLGWLAALYVQCSKQEKLEGLGNAILGSIMPLGVGAMCIGALAERPSADDRRFVLWTTACIVGWWLLMLLAGIVRVRGARWGKGVQALLVGIPSLAVLVGGLWFVAEQSPEPGSFWSHWNGTRLVGVTILVPACGIGLLMSLLDGGFVYLVGAFAFALMCGAFIGEWFMRSFGWPIVGAFTGGFVSLSGVGWAVGRSRKDEL